MKLWGAALIWGPAFISGYTVFTRNGFLHMCFWRFSLLVRNTYFKEHLSTVASVFSNNKQYTKKVLNQLHNNYSNVKISLHVPEFTNMFEKPQTLFISKSYWIWDTWGSNHILQISKKKKKTPFWGCFIIKK